MIRFNLGKIVEQQGKTIYQVSKATGIRLNTLSQWAKNEELEDEKKVKAIGVTVLDALCEELGCTVGELIEYVKT